MKVISFYSYKGGAGRSTLAYNTIPVLAQDFVHPTAKNPMVILDMDIDSCGMGMLLGAPVKTVKTEEEEKASGVKVENAITLQYLLSNMCPRTPTATVEDHPILGKLRPVGKAFGYEDDRAILLVDTIQGKKIDGGSDSNYSSHHLDPYIQSFLNCCKRMGVSTVVFDSAVGDQLTANLSNNFANILVCCLRPTRQFRDGTAAYLGRIPEKNFKIGKHIILVPNVVPTVSMTLDGRPYPEEAIYQVDKAFKSLPKNDPSNTYHTDFLDKDNFGIPALSRFMWCEDILRNQKSLTDEEKVVLSGYTKLAKIINDISFDN